ncbi:macrophage mannose receptor 1-like [Hypomesus transpacificus]|uniref:macrophage mannose receptor 1-like n=1 Tax=Hypomesus transpacificus TaxID=137520 RepID=UPI001F076D36|nr:macrophage mannose receptor 1-like [Hypomesus transpacificus]
MNQLLCRGIKHCPGRWGGDTDSRSELTPAAPTAFTHPTSGMEKSVLLMLLVLSGLSILPSCFSFHYEFVNESKTWYEAQRICRENYTDLATFYDNTTNPVKEFPHVRAWIGLSSGSWIWSLKDTILDSSYTDFYQADKDVPEQSYENKICAKMFDMSWKPFNCSEEIPFICYDINDGKKYICPRQNKTWNESQSYCRANHIDLVSVKTLDEKKQIFSQIIPEPYCQKGFWIGLSRVKWQWSDQSNFDIGNWNVKQPNKWDEKQCVEMSIPSRVWNNDGCEQAKPFICYNDDLVLVRENKTWVEALNHCRENRWDLVSIHSERIQHWVQRQARKATTPYVWLGLRYTCILQVWFWVSEQALCYQNWALGHGGSWEECKKSGAMPREGPQQWEGKNQTEKLNFICNKKPHDY